MSNQRYIRPPWPLYRTSLIVVVPLVLWLAYTITVSRFEPLQKLYWHDYLTSSLPSASSLLPSLPYQKATTEAEPMQVILCAGPRATPVTLPMWRTVSAGDIRLVGIPMAKADWHQWLQRHIYGRPPLGLLLQPIFVALLLSAALSGGAYRLDQERQFQFRSSSRLLRGPETLTPQQFQSRVKGNGIGFNVDVGRWFWKKEIALRIERDLESFHFLTTGDPGGGKTSLMFAMADQAIAEGRRIICYDPDLQFIQRYWRPGDIIAGIDGRAAPWNPCDEIDWTSWSTADATINSFVTSLYPGTPQRRDWFFVSNVREMVKLILVNHRPNAAQLAQIFENPVLIDTIAKGTALEEIYSEGADSQRAGLIGHMVANIISMLKQIKTPTPDEPGWSTREYARTRHCNIFFTSTEETRESSAPLQRLWIDMLIRQIISVGERPDLTQVALFIDECPALGELSMMPTLSTRTRKTGLLAVIGIQNASQIKALYNEFAEGILGGPYSKVLLKAGGKEGQEWSSAILGQVTVERLREHRDANGRKGYTPERITEPAVLPSEFSGQERRSGYFRYGNFIVPITISIPPPVEAKCPGYVAPVGNPPAILPMPNLAEIQRKLALEREQAAQKHAVSGLTVAAKPKKAGKAADKEETKSEATPEPFAPVEEEEASGPNVLPFVPKKTPGKITLLQEAAAASTGEIEVTFFICGGSNCNTVEAYKGDIEEPLAFCTECGGDFYAIKGRFARALGKA